MVLSWYFYPSVSFTRLVSLFRPFRILLLLCLLRPLFLPLTIKFQESLFPPYHLYPHSQIPICLQTQIQYRTNSNILVDGVLAAEDIRLHLLQACHQHRRHQRWVLSTPLCITLCLNPHQPVGHPMVETLQCLTDTGVHYPCLQSKKSISCMTILYKIPEVWASYPFRPNILYIISYVCQALRKF